MQKIQKYHLINIVLLLFALGVLLMLHLMHVIDVFMFAFEIVVFCVAICIFVRGIIFKSDSSLWFSFVLFGICVIMTLYRINFLDLKLWWPMFFVLPVISSGFIAVVFKDYMQLSISVLLALLLVPMFIFSFGYLTLMAFILVVCGCFVTEIIITALILNRIKRIK